MVCFYVYCSNLCNTINLASCTSLRCLGIDGSTIATTSYILSMNRNILTVLLNSFDFCFKVWNLCSWLICYCWININTNDRSAFDIVVTMMGMVGACSTVFAIDAIPMKYKNKRNVCC